MGRAMLRWRSITRLAALFVTAQLTVAATRAEEYEITLNSGSVFTIELDDQTINWTDVTAEGQLKEQPLKLSEVKTLVLSRAPASNQIAKLRRLILMLDSEDYQAREQAELELADPQLQSRATGLLQAKVKDNNSSAELRYRALRVLSHFKRSSPAGDTEFDYATLSDDTSLEGDAGDFSLRGSLRGAEVQLARPQIRMIRNLALPQTPTPSNPTAVRESPRVNVRIYHDHEGEFLLPHQRLVEFETSPSAADLVREQDISETFIPWGLRLETERIGFVGISGFPLSRDGPVGLNSICVFERRGTFNKQFIGEMVIRFCLPNQRSIPAGVHEVGFFIAKISHRRDIIVEAYGARGDLLGVIESTDASVNFCGIKSSEPITMLRVLSNPHLFRVDRIVDEDYAIDSLSFSDPVPVPISSDVRQIQDPEKWNPENPLYRNPPRRGSRGSEEIAELIPDEFQTNEVHLKNGDVLLARTIDFLNERSIRVELDPKMSNRSDVEPFSASLQIALDDIRSLRFKRTSEQLTPTKGWLIGLADQSRLRVEPGERFRSQLFRDLEFSLTDIVLLTAAEQPVRLPQLTDFETSENGEPIAAVMVFPTCRIVAEKFELDDRKFAWEPGAQKIEQALWVTSMRSANDDDPTPTHHTVDFAETSSEEIPSVWLKPPQSLSDGLGWIKLIDGQQITLGGSAGFQLLNAGPRGLRVKLENQQQRTQPITIPLEQIEALVFPAK